MREGRTLPELATELQRQRASMRDFKAPTTKIEMEPNGDIALVDMKGLPISGKIFRTNSLFTNQLTGWADIPKKYADRMRVEAPELLAQNVNHWLQTRDETRLVRTMDGFARAFLSHRYRVIDNIDIIETALPIFAQHGIETMSTEVTDSHLYLKGVNRRKTVEVRKGDAVQFGVVISNSEVGLGAVHVDPLVLTLACLNGAVITASGLKKFHIGRRLQEFEETQEVFKDDTVLADNAAFFLKLRDVITAAFDETQMTDILKSIEEGTQRRLGEGKILEQVVEVTSKKYGINEHESDSILRHLIEGGDLTQWGLANAVTAFSQKVASYERATELEKTGGELMVLPEAEWKELAA